MAERRNATAAVVTLMGAYDAVRFGYIFGTAVPHIQGPDGPRGGSRTLCGRPRRSGWYESDLEFPIDPYPHNRDRYKWRATCADCKAALSA